MKPHAPFLLSLVLFASAASAAPLPPDVIPAKGGPIRITPIYHGSLQIECRGKVIQVDPFSAGDYSKAKKADVILITHTHPDHLDLKAIAALAKNDPFSTIVAPRSAVTALQKGGYSVTPTDGGARESKSVEISPLNPGDSFSADLAGDDPYSTEPSTKFRIQAVPAYNIKRGPKPGQKFHPKGQFNGYVISMGGKRIYIAGDTEATPEMKALKNIDVAFLPMNLPYTMTPAEAASGARAFKPKLVYPYHYRYPFTKANNNPQQFAAALKGSGIQVRLRGWYANPAQK